MQNEFFSKKDCLQQIPAPKRVPLLKKYLFGKSTRFGKVHVLNNYLRCGSSSSEVVAVLKKSTHLQEVVDQKKYLLPRSSS